MKQIQPVSIWYNGSMIEATLFYLFGAADNLNTSANFNYQLFSDDNINLAAGNLTMSGANYTTYSTSPDSNDFAYSWGATQLNITLI